MGQKENKSGFGLPCLEVELQPEKHTNTRAVSRPVHPNTGAAVGPCNPNKPLHTNTGAEGPCNPNKEAVSSHLHRLGALPWGGVGVCDVCGVCTFVACVCVCDTVCVCVSQCVCVCRGHTVCVCVTCDV